MNGVQLFQGIFRKPVIDWFRSGSRSQKRRSGHHHHLNDPERKDFHVFLGYQADGPGNLISAQGRHVFAVDEDLSGDGV